MMVEQVMDTESLLKLFTFRSVWLEDKEDL